MRGSAALRSRLRASYEESGCGVKPRYQPGRRSPEWLKLKLRERDTFIVCGYTAGTGSRSALGSLVIAERAGSGLRWVGEVGSGIGAEGQIVLFGGTAQIIENHAGLHARDMALGIELEYLRHVF